MGNVALVLTFAGSAVAGWLLAYVILRLLGVRAGPAAALGWLVLVVIAAPIMRAIWPDHWRLYFVWFVVATPTVLLIVWNLGRPTKLRERRP
jgi:hypothetical protein